MDGAKDLLVLIKEVLLLRDGTSSLEFRWRHLNLVAITTCLILSYGWAERTNLRLVRYWWCLCRIWSRCMEWAIKRSIYIYNGTRMATWSISSMGRGIFFGLLLKQCLNFCSSGTLSLFDRRSIKDFLETLWKFLTEHTSLGNSTIRTWFYGNSTLIFVIKLSFGQYNWATWSSNVSVYCIQRNDRFVESTDWRCNRFGLGFSGRIHRWHGLVEKIACLCIRFALVLLSCYHSCGFITSLGFAALNCNFTNLRLAHRILVNEFWGFVLRRNWLDRLGNISPVYLILLLLNSLLVLRLSDSCTSRNINYTLGRTKRCCCRGLPSGHRGLRSIRCRLDLSRCLRSDRWSDSGCRFRRVKSHTWVLGLNLRSCSQYRFLRCGKFGLLLNWFHWCLKTGLLRLCS